MIDKQARLSRKSELRTALQAEGLRQSSLGRRPMWRVLRDGHKPCRGETHRPVVAPFQGLVMKKDCALLVPADPGRWPGLYCFRPSA